MSSFRIIPGVLEYVQAPDALEQLCARLKGRVLFVGGKTALSLALPRLEKALTCDFDTYTLLTYPNELEISAIVEKGKGANAVVGVGGGKAIDAAKFAAVRLGNLPYYTLPTQAATCAPTTRLYVYYQKDGSRLLRDNEWNMENPVTGCFADTQLLKTSPNRYLAAGIADNFAKLVEPYTAELIDNHQTAKWNLSTSVGASIVDTFFTHSKAALEGDEEALNAIWYANMFVAGSMMATVGGDRRGLVLAHAVYDSACDVIPGKRDAFLHGEYVGVGVLYVLRLMNIPHLPYEKVYDFFKNVLHVPVTLEEVLIDTPELRQKL